jgi:hypothetical protein
MANRNKPLSDQALRAERAVAALEQHLNWQKWAPARQVQYLFELGPAPGQFTLAEQPSVLAQLHLHCVANRPYEVRQHIREFLLALAGQRTELLRRPELASALAALGAHYHRRLRQLADWHPKTKNVHTQLESLVRHLFDQYGDVPAWVIGAWTARRTANRYAASRACPYRLPSGWSMKCARPQPPVQCLKPCAMRNWPCVIASIGLG